MLFSGNHLQYNHHRLMTVQVKKDLMPLWDLPNPSLKIPHRSMSNLFTPLGLAPRHLYMKFLTACASCAAIDPMPTHAGVRIHTTKDVRNLALDEFCQALGYLKTESS